MKPPIQVRYFLFADVKEYSRIPDTGMPEFASRFLGGVSALFSDSQKGLTPAIYANTWGDAIFLVFETAGAAGRAGLEIRDWLEREPFQLSGMTAPLSLRIGMHAGPAYLAEDAIAGRPLFLGSHINRAARIEPITEQGQIFVSREFAALAALENVTDFRCVPQGIADLPKGAGRIPVYRLERSSPPGGFPDRLENPVNSVTAGSE